jgi:hypothetical protein
MLTRSSHCLFVRRSKSSLPLRLRLRWLKGARRNAWAHWPVVVRLIACLATLGSIATPRLAWSQTPATERDLRFVVISGQQIPNLPAGALFDSTSFDQSVNDYGQVAFSGRWQSATNSGSGVFTEVGGLQFFAEQG